ncbi:DUF2690 domain-containing protein [Streptomyces sp. NPDC101237]|uniref:DUF2690 domain-containing protein n=1 Tax=Streptomyces sp. NPDC101237 TaxID=3366139 RepID=UPI0037F249AE
MRPSHRGNQWKALPQTLPAAYRDLVNLLRRLKDRSSLTLTELSRAMAISTSSWERYLNGKQFPPRQAVQALCGATQASEADTLALWERADAAWNRRGGAEIASEPRPGRRAADGDGRATDGTSNAARGLGHRILLAASTLITARPWVTATGVLVLCAAMVVPAAVIHASYGTGPSAATRPPICRLRSCEGRDPLTTACEDPVTVRSDTMADGTRLEIRFSPSCRTGWIRGWPTHGGFRIAVSGTDGPPQAVTAPPAAPSTAGGMVTTPMIAAAHATGLRCCYYPSAGRPGRECFTAAS